MRVNALYSRIQVLNKIFREHVIEFMNRISHACIHLPKVDQINKKDKTIDDLLSWNGAVTTMLAQASLCLDHLELICNDFKIFNPLNERLINRESLPHLRSYKCGMLDEDRFPRLISSFSILNTPGLINLNLQFSRLSAVVSESLVKHFRDPKTFEYRPNLGLRYFTIEYQDRDREAVLTIL